MIRGGKRLQIQIVINREGPRKAAKYTIWTAENVGINTEIRGSIVPAGLLKWNFPDVIDWILAKHGRAQARTAATRAARARNASRLIVHDKIVLHRAEKNKEDSQ